ncbi:MAG TPA: c-type cytochrome biogenesis protein CcmI, partial [Pseudomonas sp.]|nr:c-type cytochrome biogenesis protein CcmI [Pseudomonas sp.]
MTQFWIYAALLLFAALMLLLWPVLRGRKDQAEEDRTALNIALYEE